MRVKAIVALAVLTLLMIAVSGFAETSGSLPGGTPIEVDNTQPSGDTVYRVPVGASTIDVLDEGLASLGATTLIYVLDASGSTAEQTSAFSCGEQQTHDIHRPADPDAGGNQLIDCEIAAAIALNQLAIDSGVVTEVAMITFAGSAVIADATPSGGDDWFIDPAADANSNGVRDVDEVLRSIQVDSGMNPGEVSGFALFTGKIADSDSTNYSAGVYAALDVAEEAGNDNVVVVLLSDGCNGTGDDVAAIDYGEVTFHTICLVHHLTAGDWSSCDCAQPGTGSLSDIAAQSGGTCTGVEDDDALFDVLPVLLDDMAPGASLDSLEIQVDGGGARLIDNGDIEPDLPQDGPVTVSYATIVSLGPGEHEICVTLQGTDPDFGSVTDCKTVLIRQSVIIDIEPGCYPNRIDLNSGGVVAVGLPGSAEFDAASIDPDTVTFAGAAPLLWEMKDLDDDGHVDRLFYFKTGELVLYSDSTEATLTAETFGGIVVEGTDTVMIRSLEEYAGEGVQHWRLDSNQSSTGVYEMDRFISGGDLKQGVEDGNPDQIIVGAGLSRIWIADEAARTDVVFPNGNWYAHMCLADGWADRVSVEIGSWEAPTGFTPFELSDEARITWDGKSHRIEVKSQTDEAMVSAGEFLALRVTNSDESDHAIWTNGCSDLRSPCSDPGYPTPEAITMVLLGLAVLALSGYVLLRRRRAGSMSC